jgi:hypothetical protein
MAGVLGYSGYVGQETWENPIPCSGEAEDCESMFSLRDKTAPDRTVQASPLYFP